MNLLLLEPDELGDDGVARLTGRRLAHAREVWGSEAGDRVRVGVVGGLVGTGEILGDTKEALVLRVVELAAPPPPRLGLDLVLAIPRPPALRRIFSTVAQLGVDRLILVNAARVERSYFQSEVLVPETLRRHLTEGLEQAEDTVLPEVLVRTRFRPFVEDEVPVLFAESRRLLAHPDATATLEEVRGEGRAVLAIGPEGGWVPFELDLLAAHGFAAFTLGARVLRTETLVPYLIGAMR